MKTIYGIHMTHSITKLIFSHLFKMNIQIHIKTFQSMFFIYSNNSYRKRLFGLLAVSLMTLQFRRLKAFFFFDYNQVQNPNWISHLFISFRQLKRRKGVLLGLSPDSSHNWTLFISWNEFWAAHLLGFIDT